MPSNGEIEAAIAVDPYDVAGYRVYADWLEGEGDPRAELIRLMSRDYKAGNIAKAIRTLLTTQQTHFLGPLARYRQNQGFEMLTWKLGFIHKASFHRNICDVHDALAKLLDHPSGRLVVELALSDHDLAPVLGTLCARAPQSLRMLTLTNTGRVIVDLAGMWSAVSRITHLQLSGPVEVGTLALPELRWARIVIEQHSTSVAAAIASAPWSKLEELSLSLDEHATLAEYEPVFWLPTLARLEVANAKFADELCRLLPERAKQLRSISLRSKWLTDAGVMALVEAYDRFDDLQVIDVRDATLSDETLEALDTLGLDLISDRRYDDVDE